jgi:hypothetical protein
LKGIVFNLLEESVTASHGEDAWDALLDSTGLDGAYTALGNYEDAELLALVGEVCRHQGAPADEVLRAFGRRALPALAVRYPEFFTPHASVKPFLLTLDAVIHREVVKIYPGARPPRMWFEDPAPDALVLNYRSERRLCAFAEGMIEGAAEHYGQAVTLEHRGCMRDGADACAILATFG